MRAQAAEPVLHASISAVTPSVSCTFTRLRVGDGDACGGWEASHSTARQAVLPCSTAYMRMVMPHEACTRTLQPACSSEHTTSTFRLYTPWKSAVRPCASCSFTSALPSSATFNAARSPFLAAIINGVSCLSVRAGCDRRARETKDVFPTI